MLAKTMLDSMKIILEKLNLSGKIIDKRHRIGYNKERENRRVKKK